METLTPFGGRPSTWAGFLFSQLSTGLALLCSYVLLAFGLLLRGGAYSPGALVFVLLGFACLVAALSMAWKSRHRDQHAPGPAWFAVALIGFLLAAPLTSPGYYIQQLAYDVTYRIWVVVYATLVAMFYLLGPRRWERGRRAVFWLGVLVAFTFRFWMPSASPAPVIDVFQMLQESSEHLWEGKNPYATPVSDVYHGKVDYDVVRSYHYLPAVLYLVAPAQALVGDVRYAYVLAELGIVAILWWLAGRRWPGPVAELLPLLFLYHPRGLFVLEQAWTEPLQMLFVALFLLHCERRNRTWAAATYGCLLSLKLYLVFFVFQWLYVERNWRYLLLGLTIAAGTVLPFLFLEPSCFLEEGVAAQVASGFRRDSLTIFGFLAPVLGIMPPKVWSLGVGAIVALLVIVPLRQLPPLRAFLFAVTTTMFALFLFGTQAFCNYYWFVSGLLLFLLTLGGPNTSAAGSAEACVTEAEPCVHGPQAG